MDKNFRYWRVSKYVSDYDGGTTHYNIGIANGYAQFAGRDSGEDDYLLSSSMNVETENWIHTVGYRKGDTAYILVNGELEKFCN